VSSISRSHRQRSPEDDVNDQVEPCQTSGGSGSPDVERTPKHDGPARIRAMTALKPEDKPAALEPLLNVRQAAAFLGLRPGTVYLWAETGRLPSYKVGTLRRFRLSELEAHLKAHREGPDRMPEEKQRKGR
jgi:excisionase family DNA binding protein